MRTLVLAAALAVCAVGCGGGESRDADPADPAASPTAAQAADDPIAGETLDGKRLSLAGFRGRYVFVNVWSSW